MVSSSTPSCCVRLPRSPSFLYRYGTSQVTCRSKEGGSAVSSRTGSVLARRLWARCCWYPLSPSHTRTLASRAAISTSLAPRPFWPPECTPRSRTGSLVEEEGTCSTYSTEQAGTEPRACRTLARGTTGRSAPSLEMPKECLSQRMSMRVSSPVCSPASWALISSSRTRWYTTKLMDRERSAKKEGTRLLLLGDPHTTSSAWSGSAGAGAPP